MNFNNGFVDIISNYLKSQGYYLNLLRITADLLMITLRIQLASINLIQRRKGCKRKPAVKVNQTCKELPGNSANKRQRKLRKSTNYTLSVITLYCVQTC